MRSISLILGMAFAFLSACIPAASTPQLKEADEAIVRKALDLNGNGGLLPDDFRSSAAIAVVHLPNETCVGIRTKRESAVGDRTLCFDSRGRLVLSYRSDG